MLGSIGATDAAAIAGLANRMGGNLFAWVPANERFAHGIERFICVRCVGVLFGPAHQDRKHCLLRIAVGGANLMTGIQDRIGASEEAEGGRHVCIAEAIVTGIGRGAPTQELIERGANRSRWDEGNEAPNHDRHDR
jgi:hypothetical protein